jgi:hypothetical protein
MSAILTQKFRTQNALNFFNSLDAPPVGFQGETNTDEIFLYFTAATGTAWPNDGDGDPESSVNFDPPTPIEADIPTLRTQINSLKRVDQTNFALVIPKVIWVTGTAYSVDEVVIIGSGDVYKCTVAGGTSTVEPGSGSGDGFTWQFLWDAPGQLMSTFGTTDWLPVPFGADETVNQKTSGDFNAPFNILATSLMMSLTITDADTDFVSGEAVRKLALLSNPIDLAGDKTTLDNLRGDDIDRDSGNIVWIEYIRPVDQISGQNENYKVIIAF